MDSRYMDKMVIVENQEAISLNWISLLMNLPKSVSIVRDKIADILIFDDILVDFLWTHTKHMIWSRHSLFSAYHLTRRRSFVSRCI